MILSLHDYVLKKEVDWSVLHQGFTIPVTIQVAFYRSIQEYLPRGRKKEVKFYLEGVTYKATLINQKIDVHKFGVRQDILQIRYNPYSDLALKLREIFKFSYDYISNERELYQGNIRKHFRVPTSNREYLTVYSTEYKDTYLLEAISLSDRITYENEIKRISENVYEDSVNYIATDEKASILIEERTIKIRRLSRAIGNSLKELYSYRCQICNKQIGEKYGVQVIEAHHIDPFVESLNNDASNLIVICPNHHRVIHSVEPVFVREKLQFQYNNEYVEEIVLNKHL